MLKTRSQRRQRRRGGHTQSAQAARWGEEATCAELPGEVSCAAPRPSFLETFCRTLSSCPWRPRGLDRDRCSPNSRQAEALAVEVHESLRHKAKSQSQGQGFQLPYAHSSNATSSEKHMRAHRGAHEERAVGFVCGVRHLGHKRHVQLFKSKRRFLPAPLTLNNLLLMFR